MQVSVHYALLSSSLLGIVACSSASGANDGTTVSHPDAVELSASGADGGAAVSRTDGAELAPQVQATAASVCERIAQLTCADEHDVNACHARTTTIIDGCPAEEATVQALLDCMSKAPMWCEGDDVKGNETCFASVDISPIRKCWAKELLKQIAEGGR